jgi:hypothetical protein
VGDRLNISPDRFLKVLPGLGNDCEIYILMVDWQVMEAHR